MDRRPTDRLRDPPGRAVVGVGCHGGEAAVFHLHKPSPSVPDEPVILAPIPVHIRRHLQGLARPVIEDAFVAAVQLGDLGEVVAEAFSAVVDLPVDPARRPCDPVGDIA